MHPLLQWLSGNGAYQNSWHCMGNDTPWILARTVLDVLVFLSYAGILLFWHRSRRVAQGPAAQLFGNLVHIFFWCGVSGYLLDAVGVWWGIWRLKVIALAVLAGYSLRFILYAQGIELIQRTLHRAESADARVKRFRHAIRDPLSSAILGMQAYTLEVPGSEPELRFVVRNLHRIADLIRESKDEESGLNGGGHDK